ncbi:endonuclease domain-containing protein [Hymenobacter koreensis]|uniref:Endonuclease domain-containing protein n=1 Tax=Hymenobacter koreensis TaxID=1084523 RepID=A0ABP8IV76_9BACT
MDMGLPNDENQRETENFAWSTADRVQYNLSKASATRMRREPTSAENMLWQHLRGGQLGVRFRRQHVIDRYIADFVALVPKLVVEVDGGYHVAAEQAAYDENRSQDLYALGYSVIRFSNEQVLHTTAEVVTSIRNHLSPLH